MNLKQRGTYLLILQLESEQIGIEIGRRLLLDFRLGYYGYVGSALGAGGLASRLKRHAAVNKRHHWHIDYLLSYAVLKGALVKADMHRLECDWSIWMSRQVVESIARFGSSDCTCQSHLFYLGDEVAATRIVGLAEIGLNGLFIPVEQLGCA